MDKNSVKPDFWFNLGFGLISLIGCIDLVYTISFFCGITLTQWHFVAALLLTIGLNYCYVRYLELPDKLAFFLQSTVSLLAVIAFSIILATNFYDLSFDGQGYHQEAVYQMGHNHWNPFYQMLPDSVNQVLWVNHYPKEVETSEALVYVLTGKIESGKSVSMMLLLASFCLAFSFLQQSFGLKRINAFLLSALLALNPIVITQVFTYLVDGQFASLLLCLLIISFSIYKNGATWDKLLLLGIILVASINIKLTAILFTGLFIIFLLALLYLKKAFSAFWRVFIAAAAGTFTAVLVVGFNPYVVNTLKYSNPFYPLFGKNPVDIITINSPAGFNQKNRFEKLFISLFSHTDNVDVRVKDRGPELKIPFSLNKVDIKGMSDPDNRIGGFGPFFGGICLITAIDFIILIVHRRKFLLSNYLAWYLIILTISIIVLEESWWARYVPQFWFIPVIVLILMEPFTNKWILAMRKLTYVAIFANIGLIGAIVLQTNIVKASEINYQLKQFKASGEVLKVDFQGFDANRVRFAEYNIPYQMCKVTDTSCIKVVWSFAKIKVSKPLPDLPKPWLMRLENSVKN